MESHGYVSHPPKKTPQRLIQGATAGTIRTVGFQQDPRDPTSGKPGQKPQTVGRRCNQGVLGHFLPGKTRRKLDGSWWFGWKRPETSNSAGVTRNPRLLPLEVDGSLQKIVKSGGWSRLLVDTIAQCQKPNTPNGDPGSPTVAWTRWPWRCPAVVYFSAENLVDSSHPSPDIWDQVVYCFLHGNITKKQSNLSKNY